MSVRPEDWPRVKAVFQDAVALDGAARAAYLAEACGSDAVLRGNVDALLAAHDQAASLLETPAADVLKIGSSPRDLAGTFIASYRLEAHIGSGGMGEVYKARDTRLERPVALKLLPMHLSADAERLRRFHAEARAASTLNHPNILVVHDFGEHDGRPFMVTEYVDGRTLRERIAGGPLPPRELLEIAVQIASALAAAHERGVLHRDIKPENVMVRPDGYVKVLDFGLAKLVSAGAEVTMAAVETRQGVVMGTPQYMSPEQARGERVDFRSDQFSLGAVLYELATGRAPFSRGSAVETAAAVISHEAETLDRVCPQMPPPLRWAIERCLAKKAADRYPSTRELHRDLVSIHDRLSDIVADRTLAAEPTLPTPPTTFVGREADLAAVEGLVLQSGVRWVTLTGAGGVGKTRLAIQAAANLRASFRGSVYFVPLANVRTYQLVPSVIAETLGVLPQGGEAALDALKRHVRAHRAPVLLVIDNFEHVSDAAPAVAELLECSSALKVLASSRSSLHVSAEHEYHVPTLTLPNPRHGRTLDQLAATPAVQLFVDRARAVRPDFRLTEHDAAAVADVCVSLDGLPLAIELAAARVKVLAPAALLARLEGRRLSLAGGARDLPQRQQALRATIDWSYELLTPAEQRLFRRLAVFAGGWTLEAAEAVCNAREDLGIDVYDGVASLVDKSLARPVDAAGADARFLMLETIREYALERLGEAAETAGTRKAHAAYYLVLAEEGDNSDPAVQVKWLAQCDAEQMNLRAALDFLVESVHAEWAMRMGAALLPFWHARAHLAEGRDRLTRILQLGDPLEISDLRARATFALATLVYSVGDPAQSSVLHNEEVLRIYRALGDRRRAAVALNGVGVARRGAGDYAGAEQAFDEALAIWRELGDAQAAARTLSNLAAVASDLRDHVRARQLYGQVRALFEEIGDAGGAAWTMTFEAQVEEVRGDRAAARELYDRALGQFRRIGDAWGTGEVLLALGHLDCEDRMDTAPLRFAQAHAVFSEAGDTRGTARVIEGLARVAADRREADRALTLAGAAAALRQRIGVPQPLADRRRLERALAAVRLGPDAHGAGPAWMNGWSMSVEQAIAYATAPSNGADAT